MLVLGTTCLHAMALCTVERETLTNIPLPGGKELWISAECAHPWIEYFKSSAMFLLVSQSTSIY